MDKQDAINKIKKCLALGRSSNQHEAANAMRQAQKLMQQYGVDHEALAMSDVSESAAKGRTAALPDWECLLASVVAEVFGCEMLVMRGLRLAYLVEHRRSKFVFIGTGAAPDVAAYAQDVLARQCARARLDHIAEQPNSCKAITKTARGDVFAKAWVFSVERVLEKFACADRDVLLLQAYKAQHYPQTVTLKPKAREVGRNVKRNSWGDGYAAGAKADLKRGLGGAVHRELLT